MLIHPLVDLVALHPLSAAAAVLTLLITLQFLSTAPLPLTYYPTRQRAFLSA